MFSTREVVITALAYRCRRPAATLWPGLKLEGELALTPFDVVQVAIDVEGFEGVEITFEGFEDVVTVGELTAFFVEAVRRARGD